jgi:DNA adenine methylase
MAPVSVTIKRPVLRWHGGKFRLSSWIRSFFPPHQVYVEPFGGAGSVLLTKEPAYAEVYNDLDGDVVNFFRVLRDEALRAALCELVALTPFSREEFERAYEPTDDPVERARRLAIKAGMGYGSSGGTKENTGFRIDSGRKWSTDFAQWVKYPDAIAAVGSRLSGVLIENRPATSVMMQHDARTTLHYVDPPYVFSTREGRRWNSDKYYRHEMTDMQHMDLLCCLKNLQGMIILSGFHSEMYGRELAGWTEFSCDSRGNAQRGTKINREVVWCNPRCMAALPPKVALA